MVSVYKIKNATHFWIAFTGLKETQLRAAQFTIR